MTTRKAYYVVSGYCKRKQTPEVQTVVNTKAEALKAARTFAMSVGPVNKHHTGPSVVTHIEITLHRPHPDIAEVEFENEVRYYDYCTYEHDGMPHDGWYWTHWD